MPAFPRDIVPEAVSDFMMPGALQAWSATGKPQHRATAQIGRVWTETYGIFQGNSVEGRRLLVFIRNCWRNGITFDIEHYFYLTRNGGGTGAPLVAGANQTGSTLNTDTWTGANPVLRAGDIIKIAGLSPTYDIIADAPNLGAGATALSINPPIFAGGSPADNAAITYIGVRLNAKIYQEPMIPESGKNSYIAALKLVFREAI